MNPLFAVDAYRLLRRLLMMGLPKDSFPNLNRAEFIEFYVRDGGGSVERTRLGDLFRNIARNVGREPRELMAYDEEDWNAFSAHLVHCIDTETPLPSSMAWGFWPNGWQESYDRAKKAKPVHGGVTDSTDNTDSTEVAPDAPLTGGYTDTGPQDFDADDLFGGDT